jgi:hypothetical protein
MRALYQTLIRAGKRRFFLMLLRGIPVEDLPKESLSGIAKSTVTKYCECSLISPGNRDNWLVCNESFEVTAEDCSDVDSNWNAAVSRKCPNFHRALAQQNDFIYITKWWLTRNPYYVVFVGHPPC